MIKMVDTISEKMYEQFETFVQGSPEYTHKANEYYFKESGRFASNWFNEPYYRFEKPGQITSWLQMHGTWRVNGIREPCNRKIPYDIHKKIKTKKFEEVE